MRHFISSLLLLITVGCFQTFPKDIVTSPMRLNPEFEVVRASAFSRGLQNSQEPGLSLRVKVSDSIKQRFFKLSPDAKLSLLKSDSTDWITNLLLYEEYGEDAFLYLTTIKTRTDWLPSKAVEVLKWKRFLQ